MEKYIISNKYIYQKTTQNVLYSINNYTTKTIYEIFVVILHWKQQNTFK